MSIPGPGPRFENQVTSTNRAGSWAKIHRNRFGSKAAGLFHEGCVPIPCGIKSQFRPTPKYFTHFAGGSLRGHQWVPHCPAPCLTMLIPLGLPTLPCGRSEVGRCGQRRCCGLWYRRSYCGFLFSQFLSSGDPKGQTKLWCLHPKGIQNPGCPPDPGFNNPSTNCPGGGGWRAITVPDGPASSFAGVTCHSLG